METKNLENNEAEEKILSQKRINSFQKKNSSFKIAAAFLIIGLGIGFIGGSSSDGISSNGDSEVFKCGEKTCVAYDKPIINLKVIGIKGDEKCDPTLTTESNPTSITDLIKRNISPTIKIEMLEIDSEEAKDLIKKFEIKTIPAFVFDKGIKEVENYEQLAEILIEKDNQYLFDAVKAGIPTCQYLEVPQTIEQLFDDYKDKIKLVRKHLALDFHKDAQKAAEAAECAGDQNKFWQMNEKLFENQKDLSVEKIKEIAKEISLDTKKFNSCLDSGKYEEKVKNQKKEAEELGISGAPFFFINKQVINGAQPYEAFKKVVEKELGK
jgi:predicted DsbA family dithiol-disulfide isomerase